VNNVVEAVIEIKNRLGIHMRSAATISKTAIQFRSRLIVKYGKGIAEARSAVALVELGAPKGAQVTISAEGPDAADALRALQKLFEDKFGED
jgi:phosphotransferase system HPr (HPr) family protein